MEKQTIETTEITETQATEIEVQDMEMEEEDTVIEAKIPEKGAIGVAILAIVFDIMPFICIGIFTLLRALPGEIPEAIGSFIGSILLLGIPGFPLLGIITGLMSLCRGTKTIGKLGVILSAIAAAGPVVFVLVMILLMRTGAVVIGM